MVVGTEGEKTAEELDEEAWLISRSARATKSLTEASKLEEVAELLAPAVVAVDATASAACSALTALMLSMRLVTALRPASPLVDGVGGSPAVFTGDAATAEDGVDP